MASPSSSSTFAGTWSISTSSVGELSLGAEEPEAGPAADTRVDGCCTDWDDPTAGGTPSRGRPEPGVDGIAATVIGRVLGSAELVLAKEEEGRAVMVA